MKISLDNNMKNIVVILGTIVQGGAHRVAIMQANELSNRGYNVTLLTIVSSNKDIYYISPKVKVVSIFPYENVECSSLYSKVYRRSIIFIKLPFELKKIKADVVISHIQGTNRESIIASKLLGVPTIVCEHTSYLLPIGFKGFMAKIERKYVYKLANIVTVLTKFDIDNFYKKYLNNVRVLENPCPFDILNKNVKRENTILAVGDLNRSFIKGWDTIIDLALEIKKRDIKGWIFKIAGGGDDGRYNIERKIIENNLEDYIKLIGSVKDIKSEYQRSSIFILTSRNEGLPMALIEAMSQGCSCISFDCVSGPAEIISNENGILVENQNKDEMLRGLILLIKNKELRSKLSTNALKSSERYQRDIIVDKLELLIKEVV